ncbi:MAG: ribonuclease HIII [Candidatus Cloacimonetes bacterium]|nr:ribonuclease HIII [Candidatus Cloacimonadota bacterium]
MNSVIEIFCQRFNSSLASSDIELIETINLINGVQLRLQKHEFSSQLNIYYSDKKGLSLIVTGKNSEMKLELNNLITEITESIKEDKNQLPSGKVNIHNESLQHNHNWQNWIGTDESGKGDFFGPLVSAGFYCSREIENDLRKMGVKDSKLLNQSEINKIAHNVYSIYRDRVEAIILNPPKYNELYSSFKQKGQKLNEMLAWMHSRSIINLCQKFPSQGAVIDKFTNMNVLKSSLKDMNKIEILNVTKGESDTAVATASIIARYHFVMKVNDLNKYYKMKFPLGASSLVIKAGKSFVDEYGKDKLKNVAKLHFKTLENVLKTDKSLST